MTGGSVGSLLGYFALTFVLAWALWGAAFALSPDAASSRVGQLLFLPGVFAPGIVAVWLTGRALFFIPAAETYGQSFLVWTIGVTALSVTFAWVYANTNGSLLLTMLLHSAINQSLGIVSGALPGARDAFSLSTSLPGWITLALLWISASYFLVRMPRLPRTSSGTGALSRSV